MIDQYRRNGSESIKPYIEATIVRRDGVRVPVEAAIADLVLEGRSVGRVGVLRNITERRRLEEQLR
jgi:PAS domain S-box-containing protein